MAPSIPVVELSSSPDVTNESIQYLCTQVAERAPRVIHVSVHEETVEDEDEEL